MAARRRLRDRAAVGGPRHQPLQRGELAAGVLARHPELLPDLQPRPLPRHTGGRHLELATDLCEVSQWAVWLAKILTAVQYPLSLKTKVREGPVASSRLPVRAPAT